jgi:hypothetical protein
MTAACRGMGTRYGGPARPQRRPGLRCGRCPRRTGSVRSPDVGLADMSVTGPSLPTRVNRPALPTGREFWPSCRGNGVRLRGVRLAAAARHKPFMSYIRRQAVSAQSAAGYEGSTEGAFLRPEEDRCQSKEVGFNFHMAGLVQTPAGADDSIAGQGLRIGHGRGPRPACLVSGGFQRPCRRAAGDKRPRSHAFHFFLTPQATGTPPHTPARAGRTRWR